jgi:hypothetical protein
MLRKPRTHLTYANVVSTIALFLVVAGAGAFAATHALKKNSVTSKSIKNGQVKTADLANKAVTTAKLGDGAVTTAKLGGGAVGVGQLANEAVTTAKLANNAVGTGKLANEAVAAGKLGKEAVTTGKLAKAAVTSEKLAANSVSGLSQIVDGTVTGSDVLENTLVFGCSPLLPLGGITAGPTQIPGGGFCAFMRQGTATNWVSAATFCAGVLPDATLPTAAQVAELGTLVKEPYIALTAWTSSPAAEGPPSSAWAVQLNNSGEVAKFAAATISTTLSDVICTYDPASKNG